MRPTAASVALLACLTVPLAGCGSAEEGDARTAAAAWFAAIGAGDSAAACRLLVPDAAEAIETLGGRSCAQVVPDLDLAGGAVRSLEVWGQRAQARSADDTIFLVRLSAGWRVSAAGCSPEAGRPYDCDIEA